MTTPATPPASPSADKRSKRVYVYWGVALGLLLLLGLFCWRVLPVLKVRAAVLRCAADMESETGDQYNQSSEAIPQEIDRLGGPDPASRQLSHYLELPGWPATKRHIATVMLGNCGKSAIPSLVELLKDDDWRVRFAAVHALKSMRPFLRQVEPALVSAMADPRREVRGAAVAAYQGERAIYETPEAVLALCKLLQDAHWGIRERAAFTLGRMGAAAKPAIPALEKALNDPEPNVRAPAAYALEKIRREKAE